MKKFWVTFTLLVVTLFVTGFNATSYAAETSSDQMILEWHTNKVWINNGELCVTGMFVNRRNDLTITKITDLNMEFIFFKDDGSKYTCTKKPVKIPMCKISANSSKRITFNFGKFDSSWNRWIVVPEYTFMYVHGVRW